MVASRLDETATEMPEEIDALATAGSGDARVSHWRIDAEHSNSHTVWRALGAPQDPLSSELRAIEERQGLERREPDRTVTMRDRALTLQIALPLPSVSLLEIRAIP